MGKTIISQARGHGSLTYRTRKKAFRIHVSYPSVEGTGQVLKLINVACYDAPVAKIKINDKVFYNLAAEGMHEGQKITIGKDAGAETGNILPLSQVPIGIPIYNIETIPGLGGKLVRTSGLSARIVKKNEKSATVLLPSKKERVFDLNARATVGTLAASGRKEKPILKAGKGWYMARGTGGRIYPRTSAVKVNVIDHPFGSGRGKRIKSKIIKRWTPAGAKVGLLKPRRTGRRK